MHDCLKHHWEKQITFFCSNQSCSFVLRKHDGELRISTLVVFRPKSEDVRTVYTARTPSSPLGKTGLEYVYKKVAHDIYCAYNKP